MRNSPTVDECVFIIPHRVYSLVHNPLRLCMISDTHGLHRELDIRRADLLLHAGDIAMTHNLAHIRDFDSWLAELGIPTVLVLGNHDGPLREDSGLLRNAEVLVNCSVMIDGLRIWGVAWSSTAAQRRRNYDMIPDDVDVVLTHVPPHGVLDTGLGDPMLSLAVGRLRPRLHVFGHIHAGRGMVEVGDTTYVNASMLGPDGGLVGDPYVLKMSRG